MHKAFVTFVCLLVLMLLISTAVFETKEVLEPKIAELKLLVAKVHPEIEYISVSNGTKGSYTENKKRIVICTRNPKTGEYYENNTLVYVLLHELAHVISKTFGHGEEFKSNFNTLLEAAKKEGIYDPSVPIPKDYCKSL